MSRLPIQVKVHESASQVIYSDMAFVSGSPLGFILNFGQWAPEQPGLVRVYSRIGMSPNHLKLLGSRPRDSTRSAARNLTTALSYPLPGATTDTCGRAANRGC